MIVLAIMNPLTTRQQRILALASLGLERLDIAEVCMVSDSVVRDERKRIIRKLGAKNMANAVYIASKKGMI